MYIILKELDFLKSRASYQARNMLFVSPIVPNRKTTREATHINMVDRMNVFYKEIHSFNSFIEFMQSE